MKAPPRPVLHTPESTLSARHAPSFVMLAFSAGAINAGAFLWASRFVSHLTGTVTQLGTEAGAGKAAMESAFLVLTFILGATASVLPLQGRAMRGQRPLYLAPLAVVAGLVSVVALFGPAAQSAGNQLQLLGVLSFAMGLMNASVATSTALSVRTTHMTGPASDFGVHLGVAFLADGKKREEALCMAALRGGKLLGFTAGALLMVPLVVKAGSFALLAPAFLILIAGYRSFAADSVTPTLSEKATT